MYSRECWLASWIPSVLVLDSMFRCFVILLGEQLILLFYSFLGSRVWLLRNDSLRSLFLWFFDQVGAWDLVAVHHAVCITKRVYPVRNSSFSRFFLFESMLSLAMHSWLHASTLTFNREGDFTLLKVLNEGRFIKVEAQSIIHWCFWFLHIHWRHSLVQV